MTAAPELRLDRAAMSRVLRAGAYRFLCFLQGFADRSAAGIDQPAFAAAPVTLPARQRDLHL